jgi:hypothetical protein
LDLNGRWSLHDGVHVLLLLFVVLKHDTNAVLIPIRLAVDVHRHYIHFWFKEIRLVLNLVVFVVVKITAVAFALAILYDSLLPPPQDGQGTAIVSVVGFEVFLTRHPDETTIFGNTNVVTREESVLSIIFALDAVKEWKKDVVRWVRDYVGEMQG